MVYDVIAKARQPHEQVSHSISTPRQPIGRNLFINVTNANIGVNAQQPDSDGKREADRLNSLPGCLFPAIHLSQSASCGRIRCLQFDPKIPRWIGRLPVKDSKDFTWGTRGEHGRSALQATSAGIFPLDVCPFVSAIGEGCLRGKPNQM